MKDLLDLVIKSYQDKREHRVIIIEAVKHQVVNTKTEQEQTLFNDFLEKLDAMQFCYQFTDEAFLDNCLDEADANNVYLRVNDLHESYPNDLSDYSDFNAFGQYIGR